MPFASPLMDVAVTSGAAPATGAAPAAIEKPREGFVIAGAVTFGTTYVLTAGFAVLSSLGMAGHKTANESSYFTWLLLPVAGPWAALGYAKGNNATGMTLVAVTSGALQTIGVGLVTLGLVWKTKTPAPTTVSRIELAPASEGAGLTVRAVGF